jgi:hypothetical protein
VRGQNHTFEQKFSYPKTQVSEHRVSSHKIPKPAKRKALVFDAATAQSDNR